MDRFRFAARYATVHLLVSVVLGACTAILVLFVWYPPPYDLLSGGRDLFLLMLIIDLICGPLLTLLLIDPQKTRLALWIDMSLVAVIQLCALVFGVWTTYQARPLFLVHEVDRFRVITLSDIYFSDEKSNFKKIMPSIHPTWWRGPILVGIRDPLSAEERQKILFDSLMGRADYSQRPEFYIFYDDAYGKKVLTRANRISSFLKSYPQMESKISKIASNNSLSIDNLFFLPVVHRQDWVAIMDNSAKVLDFLPGDGFLLTKE